MPLALLCCTAWRPRAGGATLCAGRGRGAASDRRVYYGVMTAIGCWFAGDWLAWTTGQWRARPWSRVSAARLSCALCAPCVRIWIHSSPKGSGASSSKPSATPRPAELPQVPPRIWSTAAMVLLPRAPVAGERDRRRRASAVPGIVLLLAGASVRSGWRRRGRGDSVARCAVTGVVLSLGPEGARASTRPARHVFGFHAIRAPARFAVMAMLGSLHVAALGVAKARRPHAGRMGGGASLVMLPAWSI